jgi:hypothetical protein
MGFLMFSCDICFWCLDAKRNTDLTDFESAQFNRLRSQLDGFRTLDKPTRFLRLVWYGWYGICDGFTIERIGVMITIYYNDDPQKNDKHQPTISQLNLSEKNML